MSTFKPLLAEKVDLPSLQYPVLASPKYDGFRCLIDRRFNAISRNIKPIPNIYVSGKLLELKLPEFDGELLTHTGGKLDDFNIVQSKLSSRSGMPEFTYMVFDQYTTPHAPFVDRNKEIKHWIAAHNPKNVKHVQQVLIQDEEQLLDYEADCLKDKWEGVMLRSLDGHYKYGRSTTKEGILLKMKRFFDAEAIVVSIHELMHNANEATEDALGHTIRSSHKENMEGRDTLGKMTVQWDDVQFDIGTGFTESQRNEYWTDETVGRKITFKYQSVGPNGKPRFPVFLGFRHD